MKTPITDAVYPPEIIDREFKAQGRTYGWGTLHDMRDVARRLELDRAALMEALLEIASRDWIENALSPQDAAAIAERALAAARANFPEQSDTASH